MFQGLHSALNIRLASGKLHQSIEHKFLCEKWPRKSIRSVVGLRLWLNQSNKILSEDSKMITYYLEMVENKYWICYCCQYKSNFYWPYVIVVLAVCCWISSSFLELSLAASTQLFWLKLLSKLTDSNWLILASDWIAVWLHTNCGSHANLAPHSLVCSIYTYV